MRVVIAEDETLLRTGIRLVLDRAGIEVVGEAGTADELVSLTEQLQPDLVLSDIRMPPTHTDDGLRAALVIRATRPQTAIMIVSQYVQRRYALELIQHDARGIGYLLKQRVIDVDRFVDDLETVAGGGTVLDEEVVELMMARKRQDTGPASGLSELTSRQLQVLAAMAQGQSNAAIARTLKISEKAVVVHASHIYNQLALPVSEDSHRRVLAVLHFLRG